MTITDRKLLEVELKRLAETDPLTGVPNRRFFVATGNEEVERVRRFGSLATIVMIDLDHFKDINDNYGHAAGDQLLREFTEACKRNLRQMDILARIGGEEFAALLPGAGETTAARVAEKIRRAVLKVGLDRSSITASFGIAEVRPDEQFVEEVLARADLALYSAKRLGRNRVVRFSAIAAAAEPQVRTENYAAR